MNNPYDLSDEELYGKELTWEEQEIEKLKKIIEKLEDKLEAKENIIEMAINFINKYDIDKNFSFPLMPRWEEQQVKSCIEYELNDTLKSPLLKMLGDINDSDV
ncbi:MAG: hypothetical protein IJI98_03390 [Methanosphaera sp.]|nr:hypothetical protein [Methanosphaera sp.]